jgi:hypothetical protein
VAFVSRWTEATGDDPDNNERLYFELLAEIRKELKPVDGFAPGSNVTRLPTRDPYSTLFTAAQNIEAQIEGFPTPDEVQAHHLKEVRAKLAEALEQIESQTAAYREKVVQARAKNA